MDDAGQPSGPIEAGRSYTIRQAAEALAAMGVPLSVNSLYLLVATDAIPYTRVGPRRGRILIRGDGLLAYIGQGEPLSPPEESRPPASSRRPQAPRPRRPRPPAPRRAEDDSLEEFLRSRVWSGSQQTPGRGGRPRKQ